MKLVACVGAVLLVALPAAAGAAKDGWSEIFYDTASDASTGDIYRLWLGNSDDGVVSLEADADYPGTESLHVNVDTNGDGAADLRIDNTNHGKAVESFLFRAGKWVPVKFGDAYVGQGSGSFGPRVLLTEKDLENPKALDVWVDSAGDRLPDKGSVHYDLGLLKLSIDSFKSVRSPLGMRLELKVKRSDSGGYLSGALPLCHGKVGGKAVFAKVADQAHETNPVAYCDWRFSKKLRGKQARATIVIPYAGRTVSKSVSFTIR